MIKVKTEISSIDVEALCDWLAEHFTAGQSIFMCLHLSAMLYKAVNKEHANLPEFRDFATQAFEKASGDGIILDADIESKS